MDEICRNCSGIEENKILDAGSEDNTDHWKTKLVCINKYSNYYGCLIDYNHTCIDINIPNEVKSVFITPIHKTEKITKQNLLEKIIKTSKHINHIAVFGRYSKRSRQSR